MSKLHTTDFPKNRLVAAQWGRWLFAGPVAVLASAVPETRATHLSAPLYLLLNHYDLGRETNRAF